MTKGYFICATALLTLMIFRAAAAQVNCESILQYGIFDVSKRESEEQLLQQAITFLQKRKYQSYEHAESDSTNLDLNVFDMVKGDGSGRKSATDAEAWEDYLLQIKDSSTRQGRKAREENRSASPIIANAWRECIVNRKGPIVWAERIDDTRFYVRAGAYIDDPRDGQYLVEDLQVGEGVSCRGKDLKGEVLPTPSKPFSWECNTASPYGSVPITLYTSHREFSLTPTYILKALPKPLPVTLAAQSMEFFMSDMEATILQAPHGRLGRDKPYWTSEILINDQHFTKGLVMHPSKGRDAVVDYYVPKNVRSFRATIGLAGPLEQCNGAGTVKFTVSVNDDIVFRSHVVRIGDQFDLPPIKVKEGDRLTLRTNDAGDGYQCDQAAWGNARLTP